MSNNLANLMVGFGLDLSALQKDAPEAFRILNSQTLSMSAEMKRASREGSESFRLIDEALGIHVSRPLTRILTQEFPALASTLQSLMGAGIVGALGVAALEGFEKVSRGIENAKKAQEEWNEAARKTDDVFADVMGGIQHKLDALKDRPAAIKFSIEGAEEARRSIDQVAQALQHEAEAAEKAQSLTTRIYGGLGSVLSDLARGAGLALPDALGGDAITKFLDKGERVESLRTSLVGMKEILDDVLRSDQQTGAHDALALINEDLGRVKVNLQAMRDAGNAAGITLAENAMKFLEDAQKIEAATQKLAAAETAKSNEADQEKLRQSIASLYQEMSGSFAKLQPGNALQKLDGEIQEMRSKAVSALSAMVPDAQKSIMSAFSFEKASASLDSFETKLNALRVKMEGDILSKQAAELLSQKGTFPAAPTTGLPTPISITTSPAVPTLGAGGTAAAQFDVFSKDQAAQLKAASVAYADIVTPQQKYMLAQQELSLLLQKGLIDQTAYTAGMQKAGDALVQADDHLHKMQEDLQKLLERSDDARAGVQAFFLQLNIDSAQNGRMAFDLLNTGLKSFEDELTKAVFTGKENWKEMFRSMGEEALKFMLQKDIAGLFKLIGGTPIGKNLGGLLNQTPQSAQQSLAAPGSITGLGSLLGQGSTASGTTMTTAATTLQTGSTTLMTAATELQAAAMSLQASSSASGIGGGSADSLFPEIPGFASGTDDAPGGLAWVGERGPELLNLPGGSSVTPSNSLRGGGDNHQYFDMRGALVTPDVMTKAEAARMMRSMRPGIIGEALANFSEVQKRTAGSR